MRSFTKTLPVLLAGVALTAAALASPSGADAATTERPHGLEVAVPAYVLPGEPMLAAAASARPAPSIVVLNPSNGYAPFDAAWQAQADALRAGVTAHGTGTRVLGYVDTGHGSLPPSAVRAVVDNYLRTADHRLHVDGIFFDQTGRDCGPGNTARDYYADLRRYVQETVYAVAPQAQDLVVNNPGTAVADCYLEPGHRTADVFVTFEGDYDDYTGAWLGGNVFNPTAGYYSGAALDASGTAFWHLVYDTPDRAAMRTALDAAFTRGAGYVYATDDALLVPWDAAPGWGFAAETAYAAAKG
ncbi:spherulation-specific family 4 protein [Kitasatospora purpeofusca]|uniref:Spherulation-specific family 4 protein n=1 Tax=Kitasatospora purpeofusca TaxID=67352 RepID=A0ABZ1TT75_9ACTN|nr:spherulation-specific family 4 protein [Kitasatospora purpeofusca]